MRKADGISASSSENFRAMKRDMRWKRAGTVCAIDESAVTIGKVSEPAEG